jgi:hypothetical protein
MPMTITIYDLAWERWTRASDALVAADEELRGLKHLAEAHPSKQFAWKKVKAAYRELGDAMAELNPEFTPT